MLGWLIRKILDNTLRFVATVIWLLVGLVWCVMVGPPLLKWLWEEWIGFDPPRNDDPYAFWPIGIFLFLTWIVKMIYEHSDDFDVIRGRRLAPAKSARRAARKKLKGGVYPWGGLKVPPANATKNFVAVGSPGSGKTVALDYVLREVLREGQPRRPVLILDVKNEYPAKLVHHMGVPEKDIIRVNPFDQRGRAWMLGFDLNGAEDLELCTQMLFPLNPTERQPFFDYACRDLATALFNSYWLGWKKRMGPKRPFHFRDILLGLGRLEYIKAILEWYPDINQDALSYFQDPRLLANIKATLATKTRPYRTIASYWHRRVHSEHGHLDEKLFTVQRWIESARNPDYPNILLLGYSHRAEEALTRLHSAIFSQVAAELLNGPNGFEADPQAWIFLDELGTAVKHMAGGLNSIVAKGRDKGIVVAAGIQDVSPFEEKTLESTIGHIGNKAFFRQAPQSADWASKVFGVSEAWEVTGFSHTDGPQPHTSTSTSKHNRTLVMPSEFTSIPGKGARGELGGYYLTHGIDDAYRHAMKIRQIARDFPPFTDEAEQQRLNLMPWPKLSEDERELAFLEPWSPEDLRELGLSDVDPLDVPSQPLSEDELSQLREDGLDYQ